MKTTELYKTFVLGASSVISYLFGGWDSILETLIIFVIIDYVTGMIAAGYEGELKSSVGYKGIGRKVFIFFIIMVAHFVDKAMGDSDLLRNTTIYFYIGMELVSILENAGRVGLPIPQQIKNAIDILNNKTNKRGR